MQAVVPTSPASLGTPAPPADLREVIADLVTAATAALRASSRPGTEPNQDQIARWCESVGGVDPRLEHVALLHGLAMVAREPLVDELAAGFHQRLLDAGSYLPALLASGGVPWLLISMALDDVPAPPGVFDRPLPPRIARFYWQRLRSYLLWAAATQFAGPLVGPAT